MIGIIVPLAIAVLTVPNKFTKICIQISGILTLIFFIIVLLLGIINYSPLGE